MATNRQALDGVANPQLAGGGVVIRCTADESRRYILREIKGRGKTGVAWAATDRFNRQWVIKFALKEDYGSHSLEAEAQRVADLSSDRIPKIDFYGEPEFPGGLDGKPFYAMVVKFIEGDSFNKYIAEHGDEITVPVFLQFAQGLCEVLADLAHHRLSHNDLHGDNIIISPTVNPLTGETLLNLVVIDTGTLKTEERRLELVEGWQKQRGVLEAAAKESNTDLSGSIEKLNRWISWFGRTDQEWVVAHLCSLYNCLIARMPHLDVASRRFLRALPDLLDRMDDYDPSARLSDPRQMYAALERLWVESLQPEQQQMSSPFDLMSAELIRNDRQLMELFSDEFPGLDECRSNDPVYIYGPRGCGKSTILRSLSLKALLAANNPTEELRKVPFIGVYVSCSSELRSRFWLMPEEDYDVLESHVIRYFNLLLIEELSDTLDEMYQWDQSAKADFRFGVERDMAAQICQAVRRRLGLDDMGARYAQTSPFSLLKSQVRRERDHVWSQILDRETAAKRPDAQLLFDVCRDIAELCPVFSKRQLAFLLDDYSNQRVPRALQRKLNQAISFAKQGTPIFKVTSEYQGVDLSGIQEGREVREVNVGLRYVNLQDDHRWSFLRNVLDKRFEYLKTPAQILQILPLSRIGPSIPMAKAIKEAFRGGPPFYYHGLDTISDLCSGDFAMGLDLIRRIFDEGKVRWRTPAVVQPPVQHRAIERYSGREHDYVRYLAPYGREKHIVIDRLCWFARECVLKNSTRKEGQEVPLIKIHLDIAESVMVDLEQKDPTSYQVFSDIVQRGLLFPLDDSKSRVGHKGTARFQIRRVLLARYGAPLARHTPIKIDTLERMRFLLTEPDEFVKKELNVQDAWELFGPTPPDAANPTGEP